MRTVNVPLLVALLIGAVVLGGGVFALHRFQVKRNANVFLEQAQLAQKGMEESPPADDKDRAQQMGEILRQYDAYLALRPDDTDAVEALGDFLLSQKQPIAAFDKYERVLRQAPLRNDVRRKLVDVAIDLGQRMQMHPDPGERARQSSRWFTAANEHLQVLVKDRPNDAELLEMTGRCLIALAKDDEAEVFWRRAIAADPQQVEAHSRLAGLLRNRNKAADADKLIDGLAHDNPDLHGAQLAAANYALSVGDLDKATERVNRSLELKADDRDTLMLAARTAAARFARLAAERKADEAKATLDEARGYAKKVRELYPTESDVYLTAAEIEARSGQSAAAAEILREGLKATDDNFMLVYSAVNLLLDIGQRDEAQSIYDRVAGAAFPEAMKAFLLGRLKLGDEQWRDAIKHFAAARPGLAGNSQLIKQIDYYTGRAWAQLGNQDQAIRSYRQALMSDPNYGQAQAALLEGLIQTGQIEPAVDLYRQLAGRMPSGGLLTAARLMILRNMRLGPAERDWVTVERILDEATKAEPLSPQVPLIRADVYLAQGRQADAEKMLEQAREKMPDRPEVWSASILLAQRPDNWDKVETLLKQANEQAGDRIELRLARARYLAQRYGKEAAAQVRALADDVEKFAPAERLALWNGLTNVMLQVEDLPAARELCRRVADAQPNNVQIRFMLFELALRASDSTGLNNVLEEIERIEGQGAMWHYGKAVILSIESKDRNDAKLELALQHLRSAMEQRPTWARIRLLMAGVYDQQGKPNEAYPFYFDAVERGERNAAAIRRLVQLQVQRRDYPAAQKTLALLENSTVGLSEDMEKIKRTINVQQGDYKEALESARTLAAGSKNFGDYLWLGQMLEISSRQATDPADATKQHDEAEKAFREALQLAPDSSDAWVAIVRFYSASNEPTKAENAIAQAAEKLDPKDAPLALAQCYEALGRGEEALKRYQEALAASPKDPMVVRIVADFYWRTNQLAQAEELTKKLLNGEVPGQAGDAVWARRMMAVLLTTRGGPGLQEALKLVEQNLTSDQNSVVDLRLKGSILAAMPSRPETRGAIDAFQKALAVSTTAEDQFILAQLFMKDGNWAKCSELMRTLVATHGNEPRYLAFYVSQLLRRDEVVNVEPYLARLESLAPNQFITIQLRADMLMRQKQYERAAQSLKAFIDRDGALPADRPTRMRLVAETLEQFSHRIREPGQRAAAEGFARDAEMCYRNYVEVRPEHEILMVGFLARLGKIGAALDVLEPIWEKNQPQAVASSVLEFARSSAVRHDDLVRLEGIVTQALAKFNRPTSLMLVMAEIYQKENRTAEAERLYRDVIKNEPKNFVALNNLAVLLALENRNLEEALRLINQAIEQAGREPQILDSRASVYIAMKRPSEALRDLEEAINDAPEPVRLFHRAQAYYLAGNRRAAAESLTTAIEKGLTVDQLQTPERKPFEELKKVVDLEAASRL
jgi:tetratricopeptide (TPR) repeat protein